MSGQLIASQLLNGLQYGLLLFLLSAGLTLVLGIMNFVNLIHGSFYMVGAYAGVETYNYTESFLAAVLAGILVPVVVSILLERILLKHFYARDHLYQVLCTFGLILVFRDACRAIWGPAPQYVSTPEWALNSISILGMNYPAYRLAIIVLGLAVAAGLYILIERTRLGMLIRAGASDRTMLSALGTNVALLNTTIFALGAALAGLAGIAAAPLLSVQPTMGDSILIVTLVVVVCGGIGSIKGAFFAALLVGMTDTVGRFVLPQLARMFFERDVAQAIGPALASMVIYFVMTASVLINSRGRRV